MSRGNLMRLGAFGVDIVLAFTAIIAAFVLRLGELPTFSLGDLAGLGSVLLVFVVSAQLYGLNRGSWRYVSISDLINIVKTVVTTHAAWVILIFLSGMLELVPRSVPIISAVSLILTMGGIRVAYRGYKEFHARSTGHTTQVERVLVLGYGDQADSFIRALRRTKNAPYIVLGLIDFSDRNAGRRLHGVPVVGEFADFENVVKRFTERGQKPNKILVSTEKVDVSKIAKEVEWAAGLGIRFLGLPSATDVTVEAAVLDLPKPKALRIEDLLGRRHSEIDLGAIRQMVAGQPVMITGAGGSIGSELVRQIAMFAPSRIAIVDNGEFNLYCINHEIRATHPKLDLGTFYCDVRDGPAIASIMRAERPVFVFHAAALKHVPLVEENPLEGLHTNVLGTRNLADLAIEVGTRAFVMISTDKAVNPTNVMGASKRFAEAYCQMLGQDGHKTSFMTVRFGNVLGSTGSVVQLFKKQIERGGPVTVTHPDIERYFMTINEAVTLVLSASASGYSDERNGDKIMVLEMGQPIKIIDLVRRMIQLAGLVPEQDIKIVYTGLRPGEKMFEEKFEAKELVEGTNSSWLLMARPRVPNARVVGEALHAIETAVRERDAKLGLKALRRVVPEFKGPEQLVVVTPVQDAAK